MNEQRTRLIGGVALLLVASVAACTGPRGSRNPLCGEGAPCRGGDVSGGGGTTGESATPEEGESSPAPSGATRFGLPSDTIAMVGEPAVEKQPNTVPGWKPGHGSRPRAQEKRDETR